MKRTVVWSGVSMTAARKRGMIMDRFEQLAKRLAELCPRLEQRRHEPMCNHTSFRIGGPARLMALPADREQAVCAVGAAAELGLEPFFMGNGSNLLVPDEGVDRFIIKTSGMKNGVVEGTTVTAECGITLARLATLARDAGLTGLEFAHGIPGSLGGAVTMNAGAYDGEMAQVVTGVTCLNADGSVEQTTKFDFGYRHSAFSDGSRMILAARMQLAPGDPVQIAARMEELAAKRRDKQPLEYPSAGSMFKRPAGYFAAALIDQCGLKGLQVGGAQVSEKHAGFVVNRGGATCADVMNLVEQVRQRVLTQTGVSLEMEVKLLR